jgi:hypothetical protein
MVISGNPKKAGDSQKQLFRKKSLATKSAKGGD